MSDEKYRFLSLLGQLPARLTVEQAAWAVNCGAHDIPILVGSRLLKPLGNPPKNGIKFFATTDIVELAKDRDRLAKITRAINQHWHQQNARQKARLRKAREDDSGSAAPAI